MWKFIKTVWFNGLVVLLPLLFLVIIFNEIIDLLIGLATPIADLLFPQEFIDSFPSVELLAFLLIAGVSLLVGLIGAVPWMASAAKGIEVRTLDKVPVYVPLKSLLGALLGSGEGGNFQPAFLYSDDGTVEPVYVVEDKGLPRVSVLVPWSPTSFSGSMKWVPRENVMPVDATFDEFSLAIGHFGIGLSELLPDAPEQLPLREVKDKPGQPPQV